MESALQRFMIYTIDEVKEIHNLSFSFISFNMFEEKGGVVPTIFPLEMTAGYFCPSINASLCSTRMISC